MNTQEQKLAPRYIIGLMSGSSLDGLDIAYCLLDGQADRISWDILSAKTVSYPSNLVERLRTWKSLSAEDYILLERDFTLFVCEKLELFINANCQEVDLIVSHGHTLCHHPRKNYTTQIGNGGLMAAKLGYPVLCDLRIQDVGLGGQGAPLAALADKHLFSQYSYALNLGGIANVTISLEERYKAFDICGANQILNHLAGKLGHDFDEGGSIARSGKPIAGFDSLLKNAFYSSPAPKSLDNHWVTQEVIGRLPKGRVEDLLCSYCHFIADRIKEAVQQEGDISSGKYMFLTGGGSRNQFLLELIENRLAEIDVKVYVANEELIDYKESLLMALMGHLYLLNENNTMAEVTGASQSNVAGALYHGSNQLLQWIKLEE